MFTSQQRQIAKRYLYWICLGHVVLAPALAQHTPWRLMDAEARIEKYRMGACMLDLRMADGRLVPEGTRVRLEQTRHHFKFGGSLAQARVLDGHVSYPRYLENFANVFNYATIGFYWSSHERRPGEWKLKGYAGRSIDWAISQDMMLRGHPLMWHNTLPSWIADSERNVLDLDREIIEHVQMLVSAYPQIDQWDLYNEAPGIRLVEPDQGARRWVEFWGGPGPVTKRLVDAVRLVRPDGAFSVNHFKYDEAAYHEQIRYCLENGVKIDAIGIQSHMHTKDTVWTEAQMWDMLNTYAAYDLPVELSEISVLSCEPFNGWRELKAWQESIALARRQKRPLPVRASSPDWEKHQAEYIKNFYTLAFSHPSVSALIWWSVSDYQAWRGLPAGLLHADGSPKSAYHVLEQLINHDWRTKTEVPVDGTGRVRLKGFYGSYAVNVELAGKEWTATFELLPGQEGVSSLILKEAGPSGGGVYRPGTIGGRD